jgi:transcriptional regulator with XRE-family HTH domain
MGRPVAVLDFSGGKLRAARKRAGLSVDELSDLSCRSARTIGHYERGQQRPSTQAIKALSRALGLDYADLLSIEEVAPDAS